MKKLLVSAVLLLSMAGFARAVDLGGGWNVTIVTGTAATIFEGRGYLKKIAMSSSATADLNEYLIAIATPPSAAINGATPNLFGGLLFQTTAQVIPAIVYKTTTSITGAYDDLSNGWSAGDCDSCYVEIQGSGETSGGRASGGLHIRQSSASSGEARKAAVYWKQ